MSSLWDVIGKRGLTASVVFEDSISSLLKTCIPTVEPADADDVRGSTSIALTQSPLPLPLPLLSLNLKPPLPNCDFHLVFEGGNPATSFKLYLLLDTAARAAVPGAKAVFEFIAGLPGHIFKQATLQHDDAEGTEWLEAVPGDVPATLEGVRISLLIAGRSGQAASMKLSPTDEGPEGMVTLTLVPPTVLIGSSGFGFQIPDDATGIVIDDTVEAAPPGTTVLNGQIVATPADDIAWRGIAMRHVRFFLPKGVPFFGDHAVDAYLQLGFEPPGIDFAVVSKVPATDKHPGMEVRIECRDPTARGLAGFAPTLVEVSMTLPLDGHQEDVGGNALTFAAGKPVIARARFARLPTESTSTLTLALESQGSEGIVSVHAPEGGVPAKFMIAAAALATAIVADDPPPGSDASGVVMHALLLAALGASAFLKDSGRVVVHGVQLQSTGHGLPVGDEVKLLIDYSVDVVVVPLNIGVLSVALRKEQPMRVRNRNVGLSFLPHKSGLDMIELDFSKSDMEIEDPGSWEVHGPASLFDILGTRSGRGSMWLEVDLRFKLNLGPVTISGATIRATLDTATKQFSVSLEGLDASLNVPAVLNGRGKLQLVKRGFAADLAVNVVPMNLACQATVVYAEVAGGWWLFLRLAADLPGPIPLGTTGIGLYGVAGSIGINAKPTSPPPDSPDPIGWQLAWDSSALILNDPMNRLNAFGFAPDQFTMGVEAVLGTVADMGFAFSAKGGLFLTVPDIAVRAALWGKLMSPRLKVTERPPADSVGLAFKGVASIDPNDGVTIGLKGEQKVPALIDAVVPLGAHFPVVNPSDWFLYLGADGYPKQGRGLGPMRVKVLPDIYPQSADAYVMLRGEGIVDWPRGEAINTYGGFIIAFGFGVEMSIGPRPIAWAEVHGGADILIATNPLTLAGFGRIGGSLNLGPFSIGVDAQLSFIVPDHGESYVHARVCGHIDLFFTEIEGCAEISVGSKPTRLLPPPSVHPLDAVEGEAIVGDLAYLIDGQYNRLFAMTRTAAGAPTVWPDTLIHLAFGITPKVDANCSNGQFDDKALAIQGAQTVGNDMLHYEWMLKTLELFDVTNDEAGFGAKVVPAAPLSAAWQKGKAGALGVRPQAGELVLLTYDSELWVLRLADGGKSLPPAEDDAATMCQLRIEAQAGWAIGAGAKPAAPGMLMPSDPIDPNPCVSRFTALVTTSCSVLPGVSLGATTAGQLPPPMWFSPLKVVTGTTLTLERRFDGWLTLGYVSTPGLKDRNLPFIERAMPWNFAEIVPSTAIASARLWVAIDPALIAPAGSAPRIQVRSAGGDWSMKESIPLEDGRIALFYVPAFDGMISSVSVQWRLNAPIAVLGLRGITQAAIDASAARNKFNQDRAKTLADAAAKQPPQSTDTESSLVLEPGRTYRLDVNVQWQGQLFEQDESGNLLEVQQPNPKPDDPPRGTVYLPKGAAQPGVPTRRSYFFKTAPKPAAVHAGTKRSDPTPAYGLDDRITYLLRRQDTFEPEMLQRHLLGYSPAQSETMRFADDPVSAHFGADHVTGLAEVYGFDLKLGLRRVDVPDDPAAVPNLGVFKLIDASWVSLEAPTLLTQSGQIKFQRALTSPCVLPKPGATLKSPPIPLATRAWHEVFVQVTKPEDGVDVPAGRLPGVTFRTSRWRSPLDMLAGLGFPAAGGTRVRGDIALNTLPAFTPTVVEGEDAAFEAALDAIGLQGWPASDEPRVSQFWVPDIVGGAPGWLCAGVLIESPEPIERPHRVTIESLVVVMSRDGISAANFDLRRRDRIGSRLLYLTSRPFPPRRWAVIPGLPPSNDPILMLSLRDADGTLLPGAMALNTKPAFAADD